MTIQEIVTEISGIMAEKLNMDPGVVVTAETRLLDLGIDSIALMTLWVYLEEKFNFTAEEDVLFTAVFETIGDIANYVSSKAA
ncbi:MAG TPA: phosphopantetheine-binding protein [Bacillota bacterium]|nr:phosphopantetheine-binding protein [Bacillota bacterium]